jgi:hypothetical protein
MKIILILSLSEIIIIVVIKIYIEKLFFLKGLSFKYYVDINIKQDSLNSDTANKDKYVKSTFFPSFE